MTIFSRSTRGITIALQVMIVVVVVMMMVMDGRGWNCTCSPMPLRSPEGRFDSLAIFEKRTHEPTKGLHKRAKGMTLAILKA